MLKDVYEGLYGQKRVWILKVLNVYDGLNAYSKVYFSNVYFCKMYPSVQCTWTWLLIQQETFQALINT